ncbi:MAG: DUF1559 domain-containing protein [Planctomycetota bacterium]
MRIKRLSLFTFLFSFALLFPTSLAAQRLDPLPPQIDADAQIVVWADIDQFGFSEILSWARQTELSPLLQVPELAEDTPTWRQAVDFVQKLRDAGAKRVYFVLETETLLGDLSKVGVISRCDPPDRCAAALEANPALTEQSIQPTKDSVLLTMSPESLELLAAVNGAPSEDLTAALESRQDAVGMAMVMAAEYRKVIQSAPYGNDSLAKAFRSFVNIEWARVSGTPANSKLRGDAFFAKPEQAADFAERMNSLANSFSTKGEKVELLTAVQERVMLKNQGDKPIAEMAAAALTNRQRAENMNALRQLALAMHNFHSVADAFPPQALTDESGKRLLSWRVLLLPYLGEEELYKEFHLDEAWDSPHNFALLEKMPVIFRSSGDLKEGAVKPGHTRFLAPLTADSVMGKAGAPARLQSITDGSSNTILLLQAAPSAAVPWTKPDDLVVDAGNPFSGMLAEGQDSFLAAFADGSIQTLSSKLDLETLKALITQGGGEVIPFEQRNDNR